MKRRKTRGGLGYPPQPCGLPHEKFRGSVTYRDAYEALAYRRNEQGQTFKPSSKRIVSMMAKMKRQAFERYQEDCAGAPKPRRPITDCSKVCSSKTNPCGRSCVSKKFRCRKPAAPTVCSVDEFQASFDFAQPAPAPKESVEDRMARMEREMAEGDLRYEFGRIGRGKKRRRAA